MNFLKTKEATTMAMPSIGTDVSEGKRSLLSIQEMSRSQYHKTESKALCNNVSMRGV